MENNLTNSNSTKPQSLSNYQIIAFGTGGIVAIALFNIAGQLIGLIGNTSLGLSAFWLGVVLIIPRLWDAISDPIIGHYSDNTRTRWGRRRPYLLVGGISVAISFVLLWWVPQAETLQQWIPSESGQQLFQLAYILFFLLIFFTACTIFEVPHGALGMGLTRAPHERTKLFSAKSFFGNLFAMGTPWLFVLANMEFFRGASGNEVDGMRYVSLIVAAVLIPLSIWWFIAIPERQTPALFAQKKTSFWSDMRHTCQNKSFRTLVLVIFVLAMGFNFVGLLNYYIAIYYLYGGDKLAAGALLGVNGTIWAVTGLLAVFPLNWLSPKIGKRNTLVVAICFMILAQVTKIFCYNPDYPYLVIIPTILLSAGMLFFFTLGASMLSDVCDEDDLARGERIEGSFYSVYWWFIKIGTALASLVTGVLLLTTQFDEKQVVLAEKLKGSLTEISVTLDKLTTHSESTTLVLKNSAAGSHTLEANEQEIILTNLPVILERLESLNNRDKVANNSELKAELDVLLLKLTPLAGRLTASANSDSQDIKFNLQQSDLQLMIGAYLLEANLRANLLVNYFTANSQSDQYHQNLLNVATDIQQRIQQSRQVLFSSSDESLRLTVTSLLNKSTVLLTQTPKTLYRLRLIEIGLPILLCLVSLFAVFRYPLTDKRSAVIQQKLNERDIAREAGH
ncbi:MAG: GPH family glycoside/pentoside/hexuronide:cation symporter [Paraglaciecola sp.]|jgi:GPH family glycoside/pentoside/hexuronide:cation symporter